MDSITAQLRDEAYATLNIRPSYNSPRDWGSIPGRVIPKTQKMVVDASWLTISIIRSRSRVKWSNPGKEVAPFSTPHYSSYWKGKLRVTLDYGRQLYFFTHIKYRTHHTPHMKIDPGASDKTLPLRIFQQLYGTSPKVVVILRLSSHVKFTSYSDDQIRSLGTINIAWQYRNSKWIGTSFYVIEVPESVFVGPQQVKS